MTPIELWDFYRGEIDKQGGPAPEKMTVNESDALVAEIARRREMKGL